MATTIQNKNLNVPPLRFPEFTEEWEKKSLGELCETITDFVAAGSFASLRENVKYYSDKNYAQLIRTIDIKNDFRNSEFVYIDEQAFRFLWRVNLNKECIVIPNIGANIGEKYYIEPKILPEQNNSLGPNAILLRCEVNNTHFIYFRLLTKSYDNAIKKLIGASGQPKFNKTDLRDIILLIPALNEQSKIAQFLTLIDQRIQTQIRVIDKLESLIKGIVVEHFNQCNHKTTIRISDLGQVYSVSNLSKEDLTTTGEPCILYGELFTTYGCVAHDIISKTENYEHATLTHKGDLLFPASTTVDAVSLIAPTTIQTSGVYVAGDMFGIHISPQYNSEYISYLLNYVYNKQLAKYAQGSTIIHLHYNDIKAATIQVPTLTEQNKCTMLLTLLQNKLTIEKYLLEMLQKQKSYLLRNMFI